jgi:hypothetical protein
MPTSQRSGFGPPSMLGQIPSCPSSCMSLTAEGSPPRDSNYRALSILHEGDGRGRQDNSRVGLLCLVLFCLVPSCHVLTIQILLFFFPNSFWRGPDRGGDKGQRLVDDRARLGGVGSELVMW